LATVRQDPLKHPEGDVLEHTLQVFDRVHEERPFDEELLTAALVHEIGKAIDRANHVAAGLEAVGELVTPRTKWLVESLEAAPAHGDNTLGLRARHRLEAHPDFLDALLLAESDRKARVRGYDAPSLDEAIAILRALEQDEE
jgi:predicted HD phosphohydrolase